MMVFIVFHGISYVVKMYSVPLSWPHFDKTFGKLFADHGSSSWLKPRRCQENLTETADLYLRLIRINSLMTGVWKLLLTISLNFFNSIRLHCVTCPLSILAAVFGLSPCGLLLCLHLELDDVSELVCELTMKYYCRIGRVTLKSSTYYRAVGYCYVTRLSHWWKSVIWHTITPLHTWNSRTHFHPRTKYERKEFKR